MSSHRGGIGRSVAALAAASTLMVGIGAPAHAGGTDAGAAAGSTTAPAAASVSTAPAAGGTTTHTVQAGETIGSIAAQHGLNFGEVLSLNGLSASTLIFPGDEIQLPAAGAAAAAPAAPAAAAAPAMGAAASGPAAAAEKAAESSVQTVSSNVTEIPSSSTNAAILESAKSQLGAIQDCTVLGEQALKAAGVSGVGDESPESLMSYGTPVSNPQPGDFVLYADGGAGVPHNAIYIGDGKAIHSGWEGNQTVVESVDIGSGPSFYRI
ncbi:LysM peptidoglycan-binding domain-containing protein [Arthrobacter monumenti]